MLKKTITYNDFNGTQRTEDFYFHLSKADLAELEMGVDGGLTSYIHTIVKKKDNAAVIAAFKKIIKAAYGRRSADGSKFIKKDEYWDEFVTTEAYSEFFISLISDANAAAEFIAGCVPANLAEKLELPSGDKPEPPKRTLDQYTRQELMGMASEDFRRLVEENKGKNIPRVALQVMMQRSDLNSADS